MKKDLNKYQEEILAKIIENHPTIVASALGDVSKKNVETTNQKEIHKIKDLEKIKNQIKFHIENSRDSSEESIYESRAALLSSRIMIEYIIKSLCILNYNKNCITIQQLHKKLNGNITKLRSIYPEIDYDDGVQVINQINLSKLISLLKEINCLDKEYDKRKKRNDREDKIAHFTDNIEKIKAETDPYMHATVTKEFKLSKWSPRGGFADVTRKDVYEEFIELFGDDFH